MYICAFKFDTAWFTTLPGLLITGGVVLLLLALVLFATSSNKGKKVKKEDVVSTNLAPNFNTGMSDGSVSMDPNGMGTGGTVLNNDPTIIQDLKVQNEEVTPVTPIDSATLNTSVEQNANSEMPSVEPVSVESTPTVNVTPVEPTDRNVVQQPVEVTPVTNVEPEVTPVNNDINQSVTPIEPVVPTNPIEESSSASSPQEVDNGASPVVTLNEQHATNINPVENVSTSSTPVENPLDKTQMIPVIQEAPKQETKVEEVNTPAPEQAPTLDATKPTYQEAKLVEDKEIEVLDF